MCDIYNNNIIMTTKTIRYTLENINAILFDGFDYHLPEDTLNIISELSLQVGSPDYVKTPVFKKRENVIKNDPLQRDLFKRGKRVETSTSSEWNSNSSGQSAKMESKNEIDCQLENIRIVLNKLTDKNYIDMRNKIVGIIDKLVDDTIAPEDMLRLSSTIFDIASTNRFYSKMYAELYSDLSTKYEIMKDIFKINFDKFTELFNTIEYIDPAVNYDKFCEINKTNEKRKALAAFYLNLMANGIISATQIVEITKNLLSQIYTFLSQDNKKNEVDELTETVAILYKKELYDGLNSSFAIEGFTINEIIIQIANSKVKDHKSLTNKALFKFMDLIDM